MVIGFEKKNAHILLLLFTDEGDRPLQKPVISSGMWSPYLPHALGKSGFYLKKWPCEREVETSAFFI